MKIHTIHLSSRGTYGAPRAARRAAAEHGTRISRKRVARLMREAGLPESAAASAFVRTTVRRDAIRRRPAPDLVEPQLRGRGARPALGGRHHLHPHRGGLPLPGRRARCLFSRRIIGWAMRDASLHSSWCSEAWEHGGLGHAVRPEVIHHSRSGLPIHVVTISVSAAGMRRACPRWARSAMPTTTPWPRASSPR